MLKHSDKKVSPWTDDDSFFNNIPTGRPLVPLNTRTRDVSRAVWDQSQLFGLQVSFWKRHLRDSSQLISDPWERALTHVLRLVCKNHVEYNETNPRVRISRYRVVVKVVNVFFFIELNRFTSVYIDAVNLEKTITHIDPPKPNFVRSIGEAALLREFPSGFHSTGRHSGNSLALEYSLFPFLFRL